MKYKNRLLLLSTKAAAATLCLLPGWLASAQPTISSFSPDGSHLFQTAPALTFSVQSATGVTNVSVVLTVTSLNGVSYLRNLSTGNGLTITGPSTNQTVSAPLSTNYNYTATVQATDAKGLVGSGSVSFDTISPSYTFEAEDFDYNSGQFFDNPQTNKYAGLAAVDGTDCQHDSTSGTAAYRPNPLATEQNSDKPRLAYTGSGNTNIDYDVGYNNGGDWANYTRHFPAGLYNIYGRLSDGNGAQASACGFTVVASASGNASLSGLAPYTFSIQSTGWQTYKFYPLLDANGSLVQFTNDGTQATLQLSAIGGNYNANFYMLVPANTNPPAAGPSFGNIYPDGKHQFESTNSLSFTITSDAGVTPANVFVQLTGSNLVGEGGSILYTTANGLVTSGTPNNLNVSVPLKTNYQYTAFLQAVDQNGNPSGQSVTFDTIVPLYTFEAEDYDYNGGQFFDNPQVDDYLDQSGEPGIDYYVDDPFSGSHSYRDNDPNVGGPATESCGDVVRLDYTTNDMADYDVGFNDPANWMNYTRHYPSGVFNIFMRAANGGGGAGSEQMGRVTAGLGTSNQTVQTLGTFTIPSTGNWQSYVFCPLKDASGNLIKISFSGGSPETLRAIGPSSCNGNFYLLEPADSTLPTVTALYPNGTTLFQRTNRLTFYASSSDGIATNAIVLTVNGTAVKGLTFTGSPTNWFCSYSGLTPNSVYSASVSVTSLAGNSYSQAFSFDTYASDNYQWEAADYDYTSNNVPALFFDNPQEDLYNGLIATPGVDEQEVTSGAPISEDVYRPSPDGSTILVCTQGGGDAARPQFGNKPSWRINWFGFGDFCNYTRHYPAGTYNVVGRFTEGGGTSSATLYKVTAGVGSPNQTLSLLGVFNIPLNGWNAWTYETLVDQNNNPVVVTLDGSKTTLQLGGPLANDSQTINAGFFMLVPASSGGSGSGPSLSAALSSGQITISFPTATGSNYQLEHKGSLGGTTWTNIGSIVPGNNAVQSVQVPATGNQDFFRVKVQ